MRAWLTLLAVGGCYNPTAPNGVQCGPAGECPNGQTCSNGLCVGAGDANNGGPDAPECTLFQAKHFDACALPMPLGDLHLIANSYSWDTDSGELTPGNDPVIPV